MGVFERIGEELSKKTKRGGSDASERAAYEEWKFHKNTPSLAYVATGRREAPVSKFHNEQFEIWDRREQGVKAERRAKLGKFVGGVGSKLSAALKKGASRKDGGGARASFAHVPNYTNPGEALIRASGRMKRRY
jgi:hypothetical protein